MSSELWSEVLDKLKGKLNKPSFETWFFETTADIKNDVITVKAKNTFSKEWLEHRYKSVIFEALREVSGQTFEIEFVSSETKVQYVPLTHQEYTDLHEQMKTLERRVEALEQQLNQED
ncbi:DnaA N-terminal domain-containing protein [Aquibacillus salsiterrae]|uniref:DnaA N-terminal domain-containing protein n=1 Tax=Aquibacillus salsiterrae TaxID=2950439 RepID=A0A9X3WH77_9BACI|nr:DnaA N-terminal domain-containing protein [Aquibacillus salsiterrae]MDC3418371.1 hypothetical protein [Aquibacillus salsiterrae]